ncbi:hypothetical protein GPX89_38105 [Nocardia sp. ET3-3]|uniref:Uncharacterized protein n=1 Tax=Nocardia terrae TaxID=2675851 RepID=A0A7K1V9B2_9NOCA|nr:hypothetical protein [Nocardia terrae]MVU83039.1 hypothetical protein [Nocardia terrae]
MNTKRGRTPLSLIQVRWSPTHHAYVAWHRHDPRLVTRDPHSSLAALDGLLRLIEQSEPAT